MRSPKLSLGAMRDGAGCLGPAGPVLGIAEGVETGLSAMQLFEVPVWCSLSAMRLDRPWLPPESREIHVFGDNGAPTLSYDPPPAKGPFPSETEGRRQGNASGGAFTIPFNLSWHPAATVRAGLSKAGLPVGLQIVGPRHRDDLVLRAARAFEQVRPWGAEWPEL